MRSISRKRLHWLTILAAGLASSAPAADTGAVNRWCRELVHAVPGLTLARCQSAGLSPGDGRSLKGTPLWLRDIPAKATAPRLKVLVLAAMHGDEGASSLLIFDWIDRALRSGPSDVHWLMVPAVNPDGLFRRPATRVNARGVDLNRNFPTSDWMSDSRRYWEVRTGRDPRRFPGYKPLSEPETRWVHAQIDTFRPDLIVSIHAPYGVLDFDGPPPPPVRLGKLYLDQLGTYPGSLGNYGGVDKGVPVVTIELKNAVAAPSEQAMAEMWRDLRAWIDTRLSPPGTATNGESANAMAQATSR